MADPPPPSSAERDEAVLAAAARLGIALPPECVPGVRANGALLDAHWANLRGAAPPDA